MVIILYGYAAIVRAMGIDTLEPQSNAPMGAFAGLITGFLLVLRSVIVTPITEEALIRGFVFGGMRNMLPLPAAIVASGVLFGVVHLSPGLMIPYALIGMLFSYMFALTGSIYPCVLAHAGFNGLSLLVASS
jgi:membrane protease YdiL (CAAX protease family)